LGGAAGAAAAAAAVVARKLRRLSGGMMAVIIYGKDNGVQTILDSMVLYAVQASKIPVQCS
jgi:hypothetical protein